MFFDGNFLTLHDKMFDCRVCKRQLIEKQNYTKFLYD